MACRKSDTQLDERIKEMGRGLNVMGSRIRLFIFYQSTEISRSSSDRKLDFTEFTA